MNRKRNHPRVFQERTNSMQNTPKSLNEPKQSVVFECSQGLNINFKAPRVSVGLFSQNDDMFNLSSAADHNTKRTQRYHAAETALSQAIIKYQAEERIQELRISALHQAFSILNAHAAESRQGAEKLQTLLANREVDPKEFQFLQQQRWREEKRRNAAEQVTQTLKKQKHSTQTQPQPQSIPSEDNLIHFLTDSRHRIPLHLSHSAKPRSSGVDRSKSFEYPRKITHNSLIPLRLKAPTTKTQFLHSIRTTKNLSPPTAPSSSTSLTTSESPLTLSMTSTAPSTSLSVLEQFPQPPSPAPGTAIIFREDLPDPVHRPVEELSITMPTYVADLLSEFEDNVATDLPSENPFIKQQPTNFNKSSTRNRMSAFIPDSFASRFSSGDVPSQRKTKRASMVPSSYVSHEPPTLPPIVIGTDLMSTSTPSVTLSNSATSQDTKDSSRGTQGSKTLERLRRKLSALRQN